MSDVLHHARYTATQQAAIGHQARFRANIEARAEALKPKPVVIPIMVQEAPRIVPVASPMTSLEIAHRIASLKLEIQALAKQNAILLRKDTFTLTKPKINQIQQVVARFYGCSQIDLQSERRDQSTANARHVAVYLCKQFTTNSLVKIAKMFGGRDHTTALHAVRKITAQRAVDSELDAEITEIEKIIVGQLRPASQQIEDAAPCNLHPTTAE